MISALIESDHPKSLKTNDSKLAYTVREASQALGISAKTLFRLEQRGLFRRSAALRKRLYPKAEIERFLRETPV